jgi:FtsH-binding integral membrane protein
MSDATFERPPRREGFAAQFVPNGDGDGFVYRRNQKGPAIAVSADERNAFVAAFSRWMDIQMLVVLVGGIVAVVLAYVIFPAVDYPMVGITIGVGVVLAAVLLGLKLAWDAPAKALATRPVAAPALSPEEARRLVLAQTTWSQFLLPVIWSVYFLLRYVARAQTERWALAWLASGLALLGVTGFRAYQKLRLR